MARIFPFQAYRYNPAENTFTAIGLTTATAGVLQAGDGCEAQLAIAARLGGTVTAHAQTAFTDGMHVALLIAAGVVAAAAVTVALLMRQAAPCSSLHRSRIRAA